MTALEIVRMVGSEFSTVKDGEIEAWIDLLSPMISKKRFGKFYELALAYLVCHKLKTNGAGESALGALGKISSSFGIGSVSDGGTSISFNSSAANTMDADAEYAMTSYGIQFLNLRKLCVVPITISGGKF